MASTGSRVDPFLAFRFEVRIEGQAAGGFSECGGLQLDTDVQDYAEGGLNDRLHKRPTRTKQANISLRRGIVDRVLWDWYAGLLLGVVQLRSGSIVLKDPTGQQPVARWDFRRAFPCRWTGPELNATQSQVAVESFELAHEGLERSI
jgi:phage tail-like protein